MLIFLLKKNCYEKIRSGEKTVEYLEVKPYWSERIRNALIEEVVFAEDMEQVQDFDENGAVELYPPIECRLRLGYTKMELSAVISEIETVDGKDTDLHIDKPVYAIHLTDVKEVYR